MPVQLSDLLAPTTLPKAAGAGAPASAKGSDGAFAQELAATQIGTGGTSAGATKPATAAAINVPKRAAQLSPALREALDVLTNGVVNDDGERVSLIKLFSGRGEAAIAPAELSELADNLDIDPAILQRVQAGTATPEDIKTIMAAYADFTAGSQAPVPGGAESESDAAVDAAASSAVATVQPAAPQADAALAPSTADSEEIALKIADAKRPYIPPRPDIPDAPAQPKPVQEGRASATTPVPAVAVAPTSIETPETSSAVKALLETIAPRATANVAIPAGPSAKTPAPTVPAGAPPASIPVPPAAQAIANTPHVTSIQGTVTAAAGTSAAADAPVAPQTAAGTAAGSATPAAPPVPVPSAAANPADAKPQAALTPPPAEGEAAEAAMAALTKDKGDVKTVTPQAAKPETAAAPQAQPGTAAVTDEPDTAAPKPNTESPAKTAEAKPDVKPETQPAKPAAEKPAAAEKPSAPDVRTVQSQAPLTDKPILVDATARTTQQQMQSLPATAIQHVASEMAARVNRGHTRFEIRLDPPELGRVDVRIEVDTDGKVHSRLMVEKSETLDLLKADQRALERALHDAGFKSDQNSLSFSLRDDRGGQQKFAEQRFLRDMNVPTEPAEEPARLMADIAYRAPVRGPGGVDMRV